MKTLNSAETGILAEQNSEKRAEIVELLTQAYWMEMETVVNYVSTAANLDGIRAKEVADSLSEDVNEELGHARQYANRIKELYGTVPGSTDFKADQSALQPAEDSSDVPTVIKAVIEAEAGAISHYNRIVEACDGIDWVTQDMVITILEDEEGHMRQFESFLREFD